VSGRGHIFLQSVGLLAILGLPGGLATQGWVQTQTTALVERVSDVEGV
jgi:hypothetical protein